MQNIISIVIPIYNCPAVLLTLLVGLQRQADPDFEVLLVDDHSTDDTYYVAKEFIRADPRFRLLQTDRHRGSGGARNWGAKHCLHSIILFLDADTVPSKNIVAATKKFFFNHPECQAVTGISSPKPLKGGLIPQFLALLDFFDAVFKTRQSVSLFDPRVGAIKKDFFDSQGGFTERFLIASVEDYEFSRRIQKVAPIMLNRKMVVQHQFPGLWRLAANNLSRGFQWGKLLFEYRRFDNFGNATPYGALTSIVSVLFGVLIVLSIVCPSFLIGAAALYLTIAAMYREFLCFAVKKTGKAPIVVFYPAFLIFFFTFCCIGVGGGLATALAEDLLKEKVKRREAHA